VPRGASRFDQLLALTEKLVAAAETTTADDSRAQLLEAPKLLRTFLAQDQERNPSIPLTPASGPTRHRPSSDTGGDIIGWHFKEKSLGDCVVLAPDTYLDENNILWNTLQVSCSKHPEESNVFKVSEIRTYIRCDKYAHCPLAKPGPPARPLLRLALPLELRHPLEAHSPFRAILLPPKSVPSKSIRIPAKSTRDERRRLESNTELLPAPTPTPLYQNLPIPLTWTPMENP
jgi:hypothetical protein